MKGTITGRTGLAVVAGLALAACSVGVPPTSSEAAVAAPETQVLAGNGPGPGQRAGARVGHGGQGGQGSGIALPAQPQGSLSTSQEDALLHLAEEEKLAHDIYVLAYETYGLRVFDNISRAETRHQDAMLQLLDLYGLPDPTDTSKAGEFTDPDLQALYDRLAARVLKSQDAALRVGKKVERVDIRDIKNALRAAPADVTQVLGNLLRGSRNHLRAFRSWSSRFNGSAASGP